MGKTYSVLGIIYRYLIQQNCFQNTLKNIHLITLRWCLIVVIVMTKVRVTIVTLLFQMMMKVLDDDKNVWQTFDIPLKIKSLFQLIYYNIHNGKKKTPLHIMNSKAIYQKCKSRELLTSFNLLGLCTSRKETKLHRNNLAKLAISRYTITDSFFEKSVYHSCYG